MGDVAKTFTDIGTVAGGLNSAVSAGMAINNALNPKKGPVSNIGLKGSAGSGLGSPGISNNNNLANAFKPSGYDNIGGNGQSVAFGGAGQSYPQIDRSHEMALLKTLQAFQG